MECTHKKQIAPFILEQVCSLRKQKLQIDYYFISGHGIIGYLKNYFSLLRKIKSYEPTLIHAHYGLSGLLANLQRQVPVVTTFHGSDVNSSKTYKYSWLANRLSAATIFVEANMAKKFKIKKKNIIPCAVNTSSFKEIQKNTARKILGYANSDNLVLFSSAFTNKVKNYPLAEKACEIAQQNLKKKLNLSNWQVVLVKMLIC